MTSTKHLQHQENKSVKSELARGHAPFKRTQETLSIVAFFVLCIINSSYILKDLQWNHSLHLIIGIVGGITAADFASGLVHWGCDTWGSIDLPIIGHALIRGFREHHVDATAITRHDFVETNGDNFLISTIVLSRQLYRFSHQDSTATMNSILFECFVLALCTFVAFTNQIHKWAHTYYNLPPIIEWLQNIHVILPRQHHKIHHVSPHDTYYCITTGWLNYPLEVIGFWTKLEYVIEMLTGTKPRADDMKWTKGVNVK